MPLVWYDYLRTTVYQLRASGQAEKCKKTTIIAWLWHYVDEHQREWDIFMQPLTSDYNAQGLKSTSLSPSIHVLSHKHLGPTMLDCQTAPPTDASTTASVCAIKPRLLNCVWPSPGDADKRLKSSQRKYKDRRDGKICDVILDTVVHSQTVYLPPCTTNGYICHCHVSDWVVWKADVLWDWSV